MGKKTNVSNAFYSAYRIGELEVQKARNARLDRTKNHEATTKQIAYVEDLIAFLEKEGRTDYPKDSNYKSSTYRARNLIYQLNYYISMNGLRGKWNEQCKEQN